MSTTVSPEHRQAYRCGDRLNVSIADLSAPQQEMLWTTLAKMTRGAAYPLIITTHNVLSCVVADPYKPEEVVNVVVKIFAAISQAQSSSISAASLAQGPPASADDDARPLQQGTGRKKRGGARAKR